VARRGGGRVVRWRIVDLNRWVAERWVVSYGENEMLRLAGSSSTALVRNRYRPSRNRVCESLLRFSVSAR
jgi:hypothetical protein